MTEIREKYFKNADRLFRSIYRDSPIGIEIYDSNGKLVDLNKSCMELFGVSNKADVKGFDLFKDPNIPIEQVTKLKNGETVKYESSFDFELVRTKKLYDTAKTGKIYLDVLITPLFLGDDKSVNNYLVHIQDISDRKMNERKLIDFNEELENLIQERTKQLRKSEEKCHYFINNLSDIIIESDLDSTVTFASPQVYDILGFHEEEIIGMKGFDLIHPEDLDRIQKEWKRAIESDEKVYIEFKMRHKKGYYVPVSTAGNIVSIDGQIKRIGLIRDISEYTKVKEEVRDSEKKLKNLIEAIPVGVTLTSFDNKIFDCNSLAVKMLGYDSKEEFLEMSALDLYNNPNDRSKFLELHKIGLVKDFEVVAKRKDGSTFWVSITSKKQITENQTSLLNTFQDITERKMTDQKLRDSEERFRSTFENAAIGIAHNGLDGSFLRVNQGLCDIVKYSREELNNLTFQDITHPDDLAADLEYVSQLLDNKIQSFMMEKRYICKDNTMVWVNLTGSLVREQSGEPKYYIAIIEDITERKEKEEELRLHSEIMTNVSEGVHLVRLDDGTIVYVNPALEEMFGYNPGEMIGKDIAIANAPTDKTPNEMKANIIRILSETGEWHGEIKNIKKNGKIFWCYANVSVFDHPEYGKVLVSVHTDITKRKKAQQKLIESEKRYKHLANEVGIILDYLPGLVFYKDASNNFLRVNKSLADAHNMTKEELSGTNLFDIYPQEQAQAYWDDDLEVIKSGKAKLNIEEPWDTDEGRKWVSTSKIPFFDEKGKVTGIIGVSSDITERKIAEEKLKESEEKFRTIVEQSSLGLIIQQDDEIKFANRAVSNIIGYPLQEINDWTVEDTLKIIHADDLPYVKEKVSEREEGDYEKILNYECRVITKSGKLKWVEIMSKALKYLGKHALAITIIDITTQKEGEEKLKEISKLKSELLSRTSHELKTPLVSIKGYVDLLLQMHYENLDFYTISMLHEIRQGCSRLESLIKDLIETSKLETGAIVLRKERENLSFLIKFCLKELQGLANIRQHRIFVNIEENMITMLEKERIYEVIVNLLSNAIKYTPTKGVIKIGSEVKNNNYIISIEDNGIGLSETDKQKIFKKFGKIERYGKGLDVVSEGSGLGLYISKGMIELHEGKIWVESKGNGKGSSFYFSLPIIDD